MKRSQLKQIIKETILEDKGYSNFVPGKETSGLDKKTLDNILLRIAKGERPSEEEHSAARGNRILDKADPENVKRILNGEEPIYEVERMQELAGLKQEIKVNDPNNLFRDQVEKLDLIEKYWGPKYSMDPEFDKNITFTIPKENKEDFKILVNLMDKYNIKPIEKYKEKDGGYTYYCIELKNYWL